MFTSDRLERMIASFADRLQEFQEVLNDLDNRIGDGDHGTNMVRGFSAVAKKWASSRPASLQAMCQDAGMTLLGTVGGASGPLYGTVFLKLSGAWRDRDEVDFEGLSEGLESAYEGLVTRGKAAPGDKTMLDVWRPVLDLLKGREDSGGTGPDGRLLQVPATAQSAALSTKDLVARKGRASYLGERSRGTCDPGAVSSALLFEEIEIAYTGRAERLSWERSVL